MCKSDHEIYNSFLIPAKVIQFPPQYTKIYLNQEFADMTTEGL